MKNINFFYNFLSVNGNIYIITDDQDYAECINLFSKKMVSKFKISSKLPNILSNRPQTKYEKKAIKNKSKITEIILKKIT